LRRFEIVPSLASLKFRHVSYLAQTPNSTSVNLNQLIVETKPRPLIAVLILKSLQPFW